MIAGFTGTRETPTDLQLAWLYATLDTGQITELHHGACQGADSAAHHAALDAGVAVHVWPPTNMKYVDLDCLTGVPAHLVTVHHAMPYLNRNREIVRAGEGLMALPKHDEQPEDRALWGGTWYTVDFAERMNKPVIICNPKGVVTQRFPQQLGQEI